MAKQVINKKPAFLKAFIACASLTEAARAVKMDRGQHYDWLESDPEYKGAYERARVQAAQTLEDDAIHWARVGVYEPIVYQGKFQFAQYARVKCLLPDGREIYEDEFNTAQLADMAVQSKRTVYEDYGPPLGVFRRSEGLMGRVLKANMPEKYGDRSAVELTGKDGGPIEVGIVERLNAARNRLAKMPKPPGDKSKS